MCGATLQEAHAWRERCLRAEAQSCRQAARPVLHVMAATDVDVLEDQKGRLACCWLGSESPAQPAWGQWGCHTAIHVGGCHVLPTAGMHTHTLAMQLLAAQRTSGLTSSSVSESRQLLTAYDVTQACPLPP